MNPAYALILLGLIALIVMGVVGLFPHNEDKYWEKKDAKKTAKSNKED